jgi:hypothetical protein
MQSPMRKPSTESGIEGWNAELKDSLGGNPSKILKVRDYAAKHGKCIRDHCYGHEPPCSCFVLIDSGPNGRCQVGCPRDDFSPLFNLLNCAPKDSDKAAGLAKIEDRGPAEGS